MSISKPTSTSFSPRLAPALLLGALAAGPVEAGEVTPVDGVTHDTAQQAREVALEGEMAVLGGPYTLDPGTARVRGGSPLSFGPHLGGTAVFSNGLSLGVSTAGYWNHDLASLTVDGELEGGRVGGKGSIDFGVGPALELELGHESSETGHELHPIPHVSVDFQFHPFEGGKLKPVILACSVEAELHQGLYFHPAYAGVHCGAGWTVERHLSGHEQTLEPASHSVTENIDIESGEPVFVPMNSLRPLDDLSGQERGYYDARKKEFLEAVSMKAWPSADRAYQNLSSSGVMLPY
ncbi:hypothetical protein IPG41_03285 [Candidatus Peregrinibacteria bacterium]|nr:MAG: hypothetical protein IPG41_03285 [Candidatus Peregrinibacteria bacterium]